MVLFIQIIVKDLIFWKKIFLFTLKKLMVLNQSLTKVAYEIHINSSK